jgi:hypothetical protein
VYANAYNIHNSLPDTELATDPKSLRKGRFPSVILREGSAFGASQGPD